MEGYTDEKQKKKVTKIRKVIQGRRSDCKTKLNRCRWKRVE